MKHQIIASLLLACLSLVPPSLPASPLPTRDAPPLPDAIQVGGGWIEFLLCVGEAHAAGSSWEAAAQSCQALTGLEPNAASSPGGSIQAGGWVIEFLLCVGEAHAAGSSWEAAAQSCVP